MVIMMREVVPSKEAASMEHWPGHQVESPNECAGHGQSGYRRENHIPSAMKKLQSASTRLCLFQVGRGGFIQLPQARIRHSLYGR